MINLANLLELERPIAVLDLETTGVDPEKDRIIQIACTIHYLDKEPIAWSTLINPEIPILNTDSGHGITDEVVQGAPNFRAVGPELGRHLLGVDIMCYNTSFDIPFFKAEMKRVGFPWDWKGHPVDPYQIFRKKKKKHTLSDAYREYGGEDGQPLPEGSTLEGAHDAGVDVQATETVLRGQLLRYPDLPRTVKELSSYCFPIPGGAIDEHDGTSNWRPRFIWHNDVACINFGKHARNGPCPMERVPRDYWQWMLGKDFPKDCLHLAEDALRGIFPKKDLVSQSQEEEPVI